MTLPMKMMLVKMGKLYLTALVLALFHYIALSDFQGMNCISSWHLKIEFLITLLLIEIFLRHLICGKMIVHVSTLYTLCGSGSESN